MWKIFDPDRFSNDIHRLLDDEMWKMRISLFATID